jgi:hypothetical protein
LSSTKKIVDVKHPPSLAEITTEEGLRYILRRNPHRAEEIAASREDKYQRLCKAAVEYNHYLSAHPRARVEVALRLFENRRQKLRLTQWVKLSIEGREIRVAKDLSRP